MICVIQRVNNATVYADGAFSGEIARGLYLLLGVASGDTEEDAVALAEKISKLRIFTDKDDKMNLSVNDIDGEVMVVSNFTLNANYRKGNRPDYLDSASPDLADRLYEFFKSEMSKRVRRVASGVFGADMRTEMSTDGPVTIVMDSAILLKRR
jgi:D-tyrosyl-tRNA(Tyr) deacylase